MGESLGIMVVAGVVGLLVAVAALRYLHQRRQLTSGRVIGRFFPTRVDGDFDFQEVLTVSTGGRWCRLLLTLKGTGRYEVSHAPRYFFRRVDLRVGTPYTLTISDAKHRPVHTESGSLGPFLTWLAGRGGETETMAGERSRSSHQGTVTLLEFLPDAAGPYGLSLRITGKVETAQPGSSSAWEVQEAELAAVEDVIPLSKSVSYPHRRVRF